MKLECGKEKLKWAITVAEKVTGKNLSLPVLSYVSLEAIGRVLRLSATNLDLGLVVEVPAKVDREGAVMIGGAVLSNFLSNLVKDEKVKLELVGDTLTVIGTNNSSIIKTYSRDDFPTVPRLEGGQAFTLPAPLLSSGIKMVAYAAALSDIKPEIASVYLYNRDGEINLVATDSFRLAERRLITGGKLIVEPKLIIPVRNISEILRILEGAGEQVTLSYNQHQLAISGDGYYLTSRLVEGVYPDYRQIVPIETKTGVVVLKSDLQSALKLSNVFADKLNQVNLRVG